MGGGLLSLSLSLSRCSHFLARLCVKFKGLFYSFCRSFNSSYRKFFLFHRDFNSSFCLQKVFFRTLCFFEIFKYFILGFLRLSLRAVFAKTAWQAINLALPLPCGLPRSPCSLAMTAKQKFKFFTQNSKHFINSTHFTTLSQILSHTQGFFIFLPQVFAQCKLIKNFLQGGHCV